MISDCSSQTWQQLVKLLSNQTSESSNCKIKWYLPQVYGNSTATQLLETASAVLNCLRPESGRTNYLNLREQFRSLILTRKRDHLNQTNQSLHLGKQNLTMGIILWNRSTTWRGVAAVLRKMVGNLGSRPFSPWGISSLLCLFACNMAISTIPMARR